MLKQRKWLRAKIKHPIGPPKGTGVVPTNARPTKIIGQATKSKIIPQRVK